MNNVKNKEIPVNLNCQIKVRLKEDGYKHWKKTDDELFNKVPSLADKYVKPLDDYKAKQDANGYVTMQLWEFMQRFGETIKFGRQPIFDTDIIIMNH